MKKNFLLVTGGTGGHVIPAENFSNYLLKKNINCSIMVDKRGYKYINNYIGKIHVIKSSNLNGNLIKKFIGVIQLFFGFVKSFFIILSLKPSTVISFGSYASFSPMLTCIILKQFYKIEIFIHEQNSVLGRTNNFFLNFANKLFLNFYTTKNINDKFRNKIHVVGSPEKKVINFINKNNINFKKNFTIFIYGGSQGSEFISKFSLNLIQLIKKEKVIKARFIIQSPASIIKSLTYELDKIEASINIKEYFYNIDEILQNTSLIISRAGAGTIRDLINYRIPSILIPLPKAKDNHQFHNASIISDHNVGIVIDQKKNEIYKAKNYIYEIYNNAHKLNFFNESFDKIEVKNSNSLIYNLVINEK
ncbi:MAG: hypothetical protein CBD97_03700 [Pelagibacteraceae bacterium TMED237]|mgnify:CR=1 FL=1|nr:MAG: hypothetical protein CBD97_03700 [Pelagibacteraceae bacterium TMED237]|tara:strand:+ start:2329 stop:3414 length:1086 start_codon:yes stop_codon:yes gene_type:complete